MDTNMLRERIAEFDTEDKVLLANIFDIAVKIHTDKPFDAAHDLDHHLVVTGNILEIVDREGLKGKVDLGKMFCAGLFHDLERGSKEHDLAAKKMKEVGASDEFVKSVIDLINEHSFDDKQVSLEGKVLWAADKIEYVSKERFVQSAKSLSKIKMAFYKKLWRSRIEKVVEQFERSGLPEANKIFINKFKELKSFIETDQPNFKSWFKGLVLDF